MEERYNTWNNEEKVRKEKKDEEFYQRYKQKQESNKRKRKEEETFNLNEFIKECNMDLKDVPKDIINLHSNFTLEDYKKRHVIIIPISYQANKNICIS